MKWFKKRVRQVINPIRQECYLWMNSYNVHTYVGSNRIAAMCWQHGLPTKEEIEEVKSSQMEKAKEIRDSIYVEA